MCDELFGEKTEALSRGGNRRPDGPHMIITPPPHTALTLLDLLHFTTVL